MNVQETIRKSFDRDFNELIGVKVHDYAVAYKSGFDDARASQWVPVDSDDHCPSDNREVWLTVQGWPEATDDVTVQKGRYWNDRWILTAGVGSLDLSRYTGIKVIAWREKEVEPTPYQPSTQDDERQNQIAKTLISVLPKHGLSDCLQKDGEK